MAGFIIMHRCINDSDIYVMPPLYLRLFERMIMEANHKEKEIPYNHTTKIIKRGQRLTSIRQLAQWVMWYEQGRERIPNPRTIMRILDWLEKSGMILIEGETGRDGNRKETLYTIVNYNKYQDINTEKVTPDTTPHTTPSKHQVQQNNNVLTMTNNENNKIISEKYSDDSQPMILTKYLFEKIRQNNEKAKAPNLQNWCNDIDKILRIDGYTEQEIKKVIDFSQNDNFWKSNILCANSLRDKMGKLIIQSGVIKTKSKFPPEIRQKQLDYYQSKGLTLTDQNKADCITVFWDERTERYKYRLDEPITPVDYVTAKERNLIMVGGPGDESC